MSHSRSWSESFFWLLTVLIACGGCFASTPVSDGNPGGAESFDELLRRRVLLTRPGPLDVGNRYRSTVRIFAPEMAEKAQESAGECSGVLIAPRLVLTAAHCVCAKRRVRPEDLAEKPTRATDKADVSAFTRAKALKGVAVAFITDGSECAREVSVTTVVYEPPTRGRGVGSRTREYSGTVRAHPDLELLHDDENLVWSSADLAVIVLDTPVEEGERFPVYKLAETEVRVGDRITMVGFGLGETGRPFGERRYGENRVSWIRTLESGSVEFVAGAQKLADGKSASHAHGGDSGGGCFSAGDNTVLVGIIGSRAESAKRESFSVFTSVYAHKKWLDTQTKETAGPDTTAR